MVVLTAGWVGLGWGGLGDLQVLERQGGQRAAAQLGQVVVAEVQRLQGHHVLQVLR